GSGMAGSSTVGGVIEVEACPSRPPSTQASQADRRRGRHRLAANVDGVRGSGGPAGGPLARKGGSTADGRDRQAVTCEERVSDDAVRAATLHASSTARRVRTLVAEDLRGR
ncbi:MAG: hypothetical protein JWL97_4449, partial [Gemmatimonadales bacterium]|nr:hypothetical protein [Gemmatimonadales bacterium]